MTQLYDFPSGEIAVCEQILNNMDKKQQIINEISQQGLLPLYFHPDKEISANILRALYNAGIHVVEYTNRGTQALENFRYLRTFTNKELPGLLLGAGTIKTRDQANDFIDAGADFIISPGLNEEVGVFAHSRNILWVPGCMTPSEIMKAEELNAIMIKLFPGNLLGPAFLSSIKELFPGLLFVPTGGVKLDEENLRAWFKSGVVAVGAGSNLINKESENGKFSVLEASTKKALELVGSVRSALINEKSI